MFRISPIDRAVYCLYIRKKLFNIYVCVNNFLFKKSLKSFFVGISHITAEYRIEEFVLINVASFKILSMHLIN